MSKSSVVELRANAIGQSVLRKEDATLLTGRGKFVADIVLPDMRHVVFLRASVAHAKIRCVDTTDATAMPGVELVWTGADVGRLCKGMPATLEIDNFNATTQPLLADDEVRFVGEALVAIVANSRRVAEDAAELVNVDYEDLPVVANVDQAEVAEALANDAIPNNLIYRGVRVANDVEQQFATAAVTVEGEFQNNRISASPLETRGCIAHHEWTDGCLSFWSSTQMPGLFRTLVSTILNIPEHTIELIVPHVGGGFGQKAHLFTEELVVCLLSREIGRPVSWTEDRRENLVSATHAKHQINTMRLAIDGDGYFSAIAHHSVTDSGAYNNLPWTAGIESVVGMASATGAYKIPTAHVDCAVYATNKCPIGAYRGVGWTAGQTARENLIDRAARELGFSPFEIRRRNVIKTEDFPYTNATGLLVQEGSFLETVNTLEQMVGYTAFRERQRQEWANRKYIGLGVSIFNELTGMGTRALNYISVPTATHDTSTVRVEPSGTVTVTTSLVSQGQGHATTLAQIAADAFGVSVEDVVVRAGTTANTWGTGTWASRAAVIGAGSIGRAADIVREKIKRAAAHMLEVDPDDIVMIDGRVGLAETKGLSFADVAGAIYFSEAAHPPDFDPTLEATATFDPGDIVLANGGHAVIAEVDIDTGIVRIEKVYAVEDCGRMINPMIVEGQIRGGIAQAIGAALLEEIIHDDEAQPVTTTYMDYLLPTAVDVPDIEIEHLETPSDLVPGGIKGMGESAMISAPAATIGAVNDALSCFGVFITQYPVSPSRVVSALGAVDENIQTDLDT